MSRQRPLRAHQHALATLAGEIATGQATAVTDILAAVTPGGGKSFLPIIAAARLIEAGRIERICWVVPRGSLRLQAEEAFADPFWRSALGHSLSVRAAENEPDPSRGLAGYITTYQAIAAAPELHLNEIRRRRTLLVVDEVHHLPTLPEYEPTPPTRSAPVAREECCLAGAEVCPEARPADGGDELHEGCLRSIVWSSLARKRSSIRGRAVLWIACAPPFGSCQGVESCPSAWINLPEKPSTTGSNWRICILVASQTACPIRGL